MTSPAEPPPTDPTPAREVTGALRELVAVVLLGANAVFLFVGLIRLLTPQGAYSTVTGRAASSFFAFIGVEAVVLPVLAVLLATHLAPVVPRAKLITQAALGEYAASAVLGGLTLLIWTVGRLAEAQIFDAMTGVLTRAAWVAMFAAAAYLVWSVWQRLYHVPRPKAEPGLYGTPQPGWSQPGQPGQPGWPVAGQAPPAGGPPASPHTWPPHGQPAVPPRPAAPPPSAAPPFGQPPSADPTQSIPRQGAEPTQAVPRPSDGDADRTQRIDPGDNPG
ncbi:hypothetical protein KIF24_25405 [Micromonospora sp. Llam7]|uniref:hypothetical protein n=1 Tax=Micromonospora tarapacensis TaxID=2835305 RepID=UPI001C829AB3|nr:hypothetical protein [Micromonospora tarapacensis]